jgi:hypothetical protein
MFYQSLIDGVNRMVGDPPTEGEDPRAEKRKAKLFGKKLPGTYKKYSSIIDEKGKTINNPTQLQAIRTMIQYLNNNTPDSNVYRPEHAHTSVVYKPKPQSLT